MFVTILDYSTSTLYKGEYSEDIEIEEILKRNGLKESQCSWMISKHEPNCCELE